MTGRLILWLCVIWLVPLMYVMLRNETKFKKNIALGVTLPYQGRTDPEVVALLARFKRQLGLVCLVLLAMAVGGIFLPVSFGVSLTLFLVWTDLCIVLPYLPYVACNRKLKELKAERGFYVDSDDKWIWGLFYYDPHDSHLIINNRVGSGTTVNLARRGGQVLVGILAALLIFMPLVGVGVMAEERSPVTLELTDTRLVAAHGGSEYEVALEDILQAELLDQRPTGLTRTWGTAMDSVLKGQYRSPDYGAMTLCLDPRTGPWLLVVTREGKTYLFGAPGSTEGVYEALISGTTPADR